MLRLIHQELGNGKLFTVGIGAAPNTYFMHKAAQFGGGALTEVASKMDRLFQKISTPVLHNIEIDWPLQTQSYPRNLPALYQSEPLIVLAKSAHITGKKLAVRGQSRTGSWNQTINFTDIKTGTGISTLWARAKISSLEDQRIEGRPESEIRTAILNTALKHQILSAYTSFVAVENLELDVSSQRKMTAVRYPQTATNATLSALLGTLFLVLTALLFLFSHSSIKLNTAWKGNNS